jgi:hypothetical protein
LNNRSQGLVFSGTASISACHQVFWVTIQMAEGKKQFCRILIYNQVSGYNPTGGSFSARAGFRCWLPQVPAFAQ